MVVPPFLQAWLAVEWINAPGRAVFNPAEIQDAFFVRALAKRGVLCPV